MKFAFERQKVKQQHQQRLQKVDIFRGPLIILFVHSVVDVVVFEAAAVVVVATKDKHIQSTLPIAKTFETGASKTNLVSISNDKSPFSRDEQNWRPA